MHSQLLRPGRTLDRINLGQRKQVTLFVQRLEQQLVVFKQHDCLLVANNLTPF